ncbi:MAG TPA: hypothetical protein ENH10_00790 [Bacteroidetes bacterium]|nr:hypothetical protein BMS3Bbin04_00913 [bacterium BMS3Bbin04]HDO64555.1 hypothetical protein [Bacteroidota bacterium]HEX03680.1 hypothetical protein [Bacteroidota bacterium]
MKRSYYSRPYHYLENDPFLQVLQALAIILAILILAASPAKSATLTVNPEITALLAYDNLDEYATLTSRNPGSVIGVWTACAGGFRALTRSGSELAATLGGGSWTIRGSATGDTAYGRVYDGVSDYDLLDAATSDSTEMKDGICYEILFRSTSDVLGGLVTTGNIHGIFLQDGRVRTRINATYVLTDGAMNEFSDGDWHLARVFITSDSVMSVVDGNAPMKVAHSEPLVDAVYGTAFGSRPSGTYVIDGAIQSIAVLDYSGMDPWEVDLDGYWDVLEKYLDGSSSFAGPQAALDYAAANLSESGPVTVQLLPGRYKQPLSIELDALTLVGFDSPHRVIIDGSDFPAGHSLLTLNDAQDVTINNLTLADGPVALSSQNESSGTARNVVISGNNVGVLSTSNTLTDTLNLIHCTLDANNIGLYVYAPDDGRIWIANSCISWTATMITAGSPGASIITVDDILVWNNVDDLPGSHLVACPGYSNRNAQFYWLNPTSAAINRGNPLYGYDTNGSPPDLGAYSGTTNRSLNGRYSSWSRARWSR